MGEHSGVGISMVSLDLGEGYIDSGKEGGGAVCLYSGDDTNHPSAGRRDLYIHILHVKKIAQVARHSYKRKSSTYEELGIPSPRHPCPEASRCRPPVPAGTDVEREREARPSIGPVSSRFFTCFEGGSAWSWKMKEDLVRCCSDWAVPVSSLVCGFQERHGDDVIAKLGRPSLTGRKERKES